MLLRKREEWYMDKDVCLKAFFSDDKRYADVVNGIGFQGKQVISGEDLQDLDSQTGIWRGRQLIHGKRGKKKRKKIKYRDTVRKVGVGINFAIVGLENQDEIDYSIPLRTLTYDADEYERQAAKIRKEIRRSRTGISSGEYLYGFCKDSYLKPVITFILYYGFREWDGARDLHQLIDFRDIPDEMKDLVSNYQINLVEIRKLKNTDVFKTDVKQVFDFIRCSEDPVKLRALVENDSAYQNMEEDAYDVITCYTMAKELVRAKEYCTKGGKIDMCKALTELIAEGRTEGRMEALKALIETCRELGVSYEDALERMMDKLSMNEEEAKKCLDKYWY